METKISRYDSNAISIIRTLAMCSIVLCHFLQAMGDKWAWVLNVGVQVFFVLSGFLYGHKEVVNWSKWFVRRLTKLYVPLYIYTTLALTCILVLSEIPVGGVNYLKAGGVDGLNHLWFMKAIALCYLITPILQSIRKHASVALVILVIIGIIEYVWVRKNIFTFSWFYLYSVGYFYASAHLRIQHALKVIVFGITIVTIAKISWSDILHYDGLYNRFFHDVLGITICICGVYWLGLLKIEQNPRFISILDKNSFYIYITHHIFILGPLSLMSVTHFAIINILIILTLIVFSTYLLSLLSAISMIYINRFIK